MATTKEKRYVRILKDTILHLCKTSSLYGGRLEVDGIICITGQGEGQELVVKVHETLGYEGGKYHETNGRDYTSGSHMQDADEAQDLRKRRRLEDSAYDEASPEYSEMSMEHDYSNATDPDEENGAKDMSMPPGAIVISPDQRSSHSPSPQYPGQSPEGRPSSFVGTSMFSGGPNMPYYIPKRTPIKHERWSPNQPIPTVPECKQCGFTFESFDILAEHNEAVHSVFTCQSCFKTFTSRSNLERHSRLHTGHKPYVCSICGKAFSRKDHLSNHATKHAYKCGTCSKRFSDKKMLVTHYQFDHNAVLTNICDFCNKGFSSSESYEEHVKIHPQFHGECPDSPGSMSMSQTSPALPRHSQRPSPSSTPVNLKKYGCKLCSFNTGDSLTLAKHSLIHADSQRCYTCLACAKMFEDPLHYSDHMMVHQSEVNVFECVICRQLCSTLQSLRRHEANHVSDYIDMESYAASAHTASSTPVYDCPSCQKVFSARHLLREHMELHQQQELHHHHQQNARHQQAFACPTCNVDFDSYSRLVYHMEKEGHFVTSKNQGSTEQVSESRRDKRKQTYPKPLQLKAPQPSEVDEEEEDDEDDDDVDDEYEIVQPECPEDEPMELKTRSKTDENSNRYKKSEESASAEHPTPMKEAGPSAEKMEDGDVDEDDEDSPIKMDPVRSLLFSTRPAAIANNIKTDRPLAATGGGPRQQGEEPNEGGGSSSKVAESPSPVDARSTASSRGSPIESNNNSILLQPSTANTSGSSSSNNLNNSMNSSSGSAPNTPSKVNNVDLPPGPYNCSVCSSVCNNFPDLEMHCFSEHNRSPCMFCSKTFAQKANRDRHVCLHTGEKPYGCPECDEKFSRGDKLKLHRIRAHKVQFPVFNVRQRDSSASPAPSLAGGSESRGSENCEGGERGMWGKEEGGEEAWPLSLSMKGSNISAYSGGHWSVLSDSPTEGVNSKVDGLAKGETPTKMETEVHNNNNGDAQDN